MTGVSMEECGHCALNGSGAANRLQGPVPHCCRTQFRRTRLLLCLLGCLCWRIPAQSLVINEIVSSNATGIDDEDGDRPDWIELYNRSPVATSTAGYGLSDDPNQPYKWRLPSLIVPGRGFLFVYASGKDRTNDLQRLHANFSIRADGERLFLTGPLDGVTQDFPSRQLPRDVSVGRMPDGGSNVVFLGRSTPRAANLEPGYLTVCLPPTFSREGGFYTTPFSLQIQVSEPHTVIRYTLDGSEPAETSPLYVGPLSIRDRSMDANLLSLIPGTATMNQHTDGWLPPKGLVPKCTVIRSRAFRSQALPSEILTRTWFVGANSPSRFQLPVISIVTDTNGLFDYERGIYVMGKVFDEYRAASPNEILTGHTPANYHGRGSDWERPASLEFYRPDGVLAFARQVQLDIQGHSSRSFRQKSLGVRSLEGDFPLETFPGLIARGTGLPMEGFSKIRLSNSGNDWAYSLLRDALVHTLVSALPMDGLAYRPCVVFLDGEYWGIHNLRERQDGTWIQSHYGVDRTDIVLCEGEGTLLEGRPGEERVFVQLRDYLRTNDLSLDVHASYVESAMDVDNFLLYQAIEIYIANADWPHNNIRYWRKRTEAEGSLANAGHDGRWRWMLFDTDLSYSHPWSGGFGDNTLSAATNPSGRPGVDAPWSTVMLRQLLKVPRYRNRFINRMADLLNSSLHESPATSTLERLSNAISPAMPTHLDRWQTMNGTMAGWNDQLRAMRLFANQRPTYLRQHVSSYFKLDGYARLTLDATPKGAGKIRVNSLWLTPSTPGVNTTNPYPWQGHYFRGVPIQVEATATPGWTFVGWEGRPEVATQRIDLELAGATELVARFEPERVIIDSLARTLGGGLIFGYTGSANSEHWLQESSDLRVWLDVIRGVANETGRGTLELPAVDFSQPSARYFRLNRRSR